MTEHFDDILRSRLNNYDSQVPADIFNDIRSRMDAEDQSFDAAVNQHLNNYASPVAAGLFDEVNSRMDALDIEFDSGIESKIYAYESDVPEDMWQRIIAEKRKRRPVAWWWAAALLALVLGGSSVYYFANKQPYKSLPFGNHETGVPVQKGNEGLPGNTNSNSALALQPGVNANVSAATNDGNSKKEITPTNPAESHSILDPYTASKKSTIINGSGKITRGLFEKKIGQPDANENDNDKDLAPQSTTTETNTINDEDYSSLSDERQLSFRQLIRSTLNKLAPLQLLDAKLRNPILPCPINGDEPRNDWYVDLYASPMMSFKNVTDKEMGKNIRTGMDSTLHKQVSFNAGVSLVKNIGENFLLKAGAQYNQVNELFKNTRINEIKLITTVTIRTVILSPGDTIYIRDTSVIQQIGTITKQTQNHYQSWDIPLILGYEFGGKDLRLNANVGVIANIRSSYKGDMLDTAQQVVNIANYKNTGVYKTNIGLGIYAGLGILKSIGNNTDLLIEPHARINLGNMTTDAAWFKQKNIVAGLSVGIRYKINGIRQR